LKSNQIKYVSVVLTHLTFELNKKFKAPAGGVPIDANFNVKRIFDEKKKRLIASLYIELFKKVKNAPFSLEATIEGTFECADFEYLKKFSEVNAPAHLFPFLREIVANTSLKAGIPPLLLPPINLAAILAGKKKK
jgi:preprotein translocase subunit SecB